MMAQMVDGVGEDGRAGTGVDGDLEEKGFGSLAVLVEGMMEALRAAPSDGVVQTKDNSYRILVVEVAGRRNSRRSAALGYCLVESLREARESLGGTYMEWSDPRDGTHMGTRQLFRLQRSCDLGALNLCFNSLN
jgi:hypothetical protein